MIAQCPKISFGRIRHLNWHQTKGSSRCQSFFLWTEIHLLPMMAIPIGHHENFSLVSKEKGASVSRIWCSMTWISWHIMTSCWMKFVPTQAPAYRFIWHWKTRRPSPEKRLKIRVYKVLPCFLCVFLDVFLDSRNIQAKSSSIDFELQFFGYFIQKFPGNSLHENSGKSMR